MVKINEYPDLTRRFREYIVRTSDKNYSLELEDGIKIDVFPYVFPPKSPFSRSTPGGLIFGDLSGKRVLDIGTGTGILAIRAALAGAERVDGIDISDEAVKCATHNVLLNNLAGRIKIWRSDMFEGVQGKYDLIVANLPILNFDEADERFLSLSDPQFRFHEKLFAEASLYLSERGRVLVSNAELQEGLTERLKRMARSNGFEFSVVDSQKHLGYDWEIWGFNYGARKGVGENE